MVNDVINIKDLVITASEDSTIRFYDKLSANTLRTLNGHQGAVTKIKIVNLNIEPTHFFKTDLSDKININEMNNKKKIDSINLNKLDLIINN
jgi:WD40 repeat protein